MTELRKILTRNVRRGIAQLLDLFPEFVADAVRQHDAHRGEQIAMRLASLGLETLALEAEGAAGIGGGGDRQFDGAVEGRHAHLAAQHRFVERYRQVETQGGAIRLEQRMRGNVDGDDGVAVAAERARIALPLQPDLLTAGDAGRNLALDLLAGRQADALGRAFGGICQRNGERGSKVLPCRLRAEILRFELGRVTARTGAGAAAEHAAQQVFKAGFAGGAAGATGTALKAVGSEGETLEAAAALTKTLTEAAGAGVKTTTRLAAEPLESR